MSVNLPKSRGEMLYREACKMLANANPIQSEWDFIGYDSYSGSINTPFIEVGGGYSVGTLAVQKKGQSDPNKFRCLTGNLEAGLTPAPFNFGFPLPKAPSTGIIFKLPSFVEMELSPNSFRAGFFSFTQSLQCGPTVGLTFMLFLPKMIPNMNLISPGIILIAGVLIVTASGCGSLVPDVGVSCSMGCAI